MKQCPTCQEHYADKFGFCPVDGTSLGGHVEASAPQSAAVEDEAVDATPAASSVNTGETETAVSVDETLPAQPDAFAAGAGALAPRGEYHLTMLEDEGLTRRLATELRRVAHESELTWPEFKRDPKGFTKRMAAGYGKLGQDFVRQPYVPQAIMAAFAVALFATGFIFFAENRCQLFPNFPRCQDSKANADEEQLELVQMLNTEIPAEQKEPDPGTAGMAKGKGGGSKPKQEKAGGGGGGGRNEQTPASYGKLPTAVLAPQILPPNPHPPTIKRPSLPTLPTIDADPALFPPDNRPIPYGDPKSKSTETSAGPGTGGGIGTGTGGGVGPGEGGGFGPGRGGNTGGGDRNEGGGGPGGGGGGGPDYTKPFTVRDVTKKAVITFKPEPGFTEEARKNNVTGMVRLRLLLTAGGAVSNISVIKGLPDGLTEKAIAAARQIRFVPAEKDGRTVSQWIQIEYNFNIY